jgi:hypothetical protein
MSDPTEQSNAPVSQPDGEETERLALAAADAIHRLVAERNAFRNYAATLERELTRLQRHFTLIRDSYRRLTSEFVTQLQHIDSAAVNVVQAPSGPAESVTLSKGQQAHSDD